MIPPNNPPEGSPQGAVDLDLVRRGMKGDRAALDGLMDRLGCVEPILKSLNRRMGGPLTPADLEDLTQDTLVTIWEKLSTFEGRAALSTWAYRYCFLGMLDRRRTVRKSRQRHVTLDAAAGTAGPKAPSATDRITLLDSLLSLSELEARIIALKHFENRTFFEIADLLELPPSTAKSHYYRGIESLKALLDSPGQGRDR